MKSRTREQRVKAQDDHYALLTELRSNSSLRVWEAAKRVRPDDVGLIPALVQQLKKAKMTLHRVAAAYALGSLGTRRGVSALEEALGDKNEWPVVRGHCAEALALLGSNRSIPLLVRCLKDESRAVRFWSAYALGVAGTLDRRQAAIALPTLRRLSHDNHRVKYWWSVGDEARWAIAKITGRQAEADALERRIEHEMEALRQKARRRKR